MKGWICLSRQITEHWLWNSDRFDKAHAWLDLLLLANHTDKKTMHRGQLVVCKRGDVNLSLTELAKRWRWSRKAVKHFVETLERDGMVSNRVTRERTTITLINYEKYQSTEFEGNNEGDIKGSIKGNNEGSITNNVNNDNNIKNNNRTFVKPTIEEVKTYCLERNNSVDPEAFISFYESKGWMIGKNKMKDWKAAVRTWERSRKESGQNSTPKKNKFDNFEQREYDYDALMKEVTGSRRE